MADLQAEVTPATLLAEEGLHPAVRRALGRVGRFITPRGSRVMLSHRYDRPVQFLIDNPGDAIHAAQTKGRFYEEGQLREMARHMPKGGVFLDVGANIGNHSAFMLLFGGAARAIPVEPNPPAIRLLLGMAILNGLLPRIGLGGLGYGLGAAETGDLALHWPKGNLGWTRLRPAEEAEAGADDAVQVLAGDDLVGAGPVDFIKMDVEGMEIEALDGLQATIARCRPPIFIEVDRQNRDAFFERVKAFDYVIAQEFEEHRVNQNFLLRPAENPQPEAA